MLYRLSYGSTPAAGGPAGKRRALCHRLGGDASALSRWLTGRTNCAKWPAMTQDDRRPNLTEKAAGEAEERRRRQAEALRANLARRKQQTRARSEADDGGKDSPRET